MLDADCLISRRVHDQQRFAQIGHVTLDRLALGILHQPPTDREGTTSECNVGDAVTFDIVETRLKLMQHVGDIGWRSDCNDCLCLRNAVRGGQHGCTTQRVANENGGSPIVCAQMTRGEDQVLDIRQKVRVLELSLGGSEPREVEPQDCYAERG